MNNRKEGFGSPPPGQEGQDPYQKEYADIVQGVREYLKARGEEVEEAKKTGCLSKDYKMVPEKMIDLKLFEESRYTQAASGLRKDFYEPLYFAWNIITYERYTPGSMAERTTAKEIETAARRYDPDHRDPVIRFTSREQILLFDAMAEACGIHRKKGQAEIPIPEKYRDNNRWTASTEYKTRVARANASGKR